MPRVAVFFELEKLSRDSWDAQTVANIMQMLRVVRLLVSPDNPQVLFYLWACPTRVSHMRI